MEGSSAAALAKWLELSDPADIDEAINTFVPHDQPLRDETLDILCKMLKIDETTVADDNEKLMAINAAVSLRVVQKENQTDRRSMSVAGRVTIDDTLDLIKIVLVGDSGVGKTCLMVRFVKDEFASSTRATIGMDFCTRQLAVDVMKAAEDSVVQRLTVQVWDTAGQEQFRSLTSTYYRKAGGVMIMYDSSNAKSFDSLPQWIEDVDNNSEGVVKMIVATKAEGSPAVSIEKGKEFATANGCLFASTSAKEGAGVIAAFKTLSASVLAQQESKERTLDEMKSTIALGAKQETQKKGGCC